MIFQEVQLAAILFFIPTHTARVAMIDIVKIMAIMETITSLDSVTILQSEFALDF